MYLKNLNIYKNSLILREIIFHKGINFIVDKTPLKENKESGNDVGKTTVLRLIDYCLGSNGKNIYTDSEFPDKINLKLKKYLEENNIEVELILTNNFNSNKDEIVIRRNFLKGNQEILMFNGSRIKDSDFTNLLNEKLFNNFNTKPSFRQLISKFIRDDSIKMSNTLRFLFNATNDDVYESVHLFLFGVRFSENIFEEKIKLSNNLKNNKKILSKLLESNSKNEITQFLMAILKKIDNLEKQKFKLIHSDDDINNIDILNDLKNEFNKLSEKLVNFKFKLEIIEEAINDFKQEKFKLDVYDLKTIYESAKIYIPDLHKDFQELVSFHNSMINNKIDYLSKSIPALKTTILELSNQKCELKAKIDNISKEIRKTDFKEYNQIILELNKYYQDKGKYEEKYEQIINIENNIDYYTRRIEEINNDIKETDSLLNENITCFNQFFSLYSKELYEEEYYLSFERKNSYKFKISNIDANVGSGKKKGQIAAFDLAYMKFCLEKSIKSLMFVLHDSPEDVSINQLTSLINLSNKIDGQLIIAVLTDKFASSIELLDIVDIYKVIELSQTDKLFKF